MTTLARSRAWSGDGAGAPLRHGVRSLVVAAGGATGLPLLFLFRAGSPLPLGVRCAAGALWVVCLLPALGYVARPARVRRPLPFFPLIGLLYGLYFAFPALIGAPNLQSAVSLDPTRDYAAPVLLALLGWCVLGWGYMMLGRIAAVPRWGGWGRVDRSRLTTLAVALLGIGIANDFTRLAVPVPMVLGGLSYLLGLLGWLGIALLTVSAVRRELAPLGRLGLLMGVAALSVVQAATGSVANLARLWLVILLAAWIARGRLTPRWWGFAVAGLLVVVALRGVADQYRQRVWFGDPELSGVGRVAFMSRLLANSLATEGPLGTLRDGAAVVAQRSAVLDVFGDVIRRTPAVIPYWGGRTYLSLVGAPVPRILWPDKPTKELGRDFGQRYAYLSPLDRYTSFNLPYPIEFYANFGIFGVLVGMTIVGAIYRSVDDMVNRAGQDTLTSVVALGLLVPLTTIESDFSLVFGGLLLYGASLWVVLHGLRASAAVPSATRHPGRSAP